MNPALHVSVLHGGPCSEHDISVVTARRVIAALREGGHRADPVYVDQLGRWHFSGAGVGAGQLVGDGVLLPEALTKLRQIGADVAFLGFHGTYGEDGKIQAALELSQVPYTCSATTASAVAMDKPMARRVLQTWGLDVAAAIELPTRRCSDQGVAAVAAAVVAELGLPVVVKVPEGGSSVGIEIPATEQDLADTLERLSDGVEFLLCEAFIAGVELTASVLVDSDGALLCLPVVEIAPKGDRFFDYEAKYDAELTDEIVPARIPPEIERECREIGALAHRALGCRAVSRTDIIWDRGDRLVVLETNTLPGLTPQSLLPKSAAAVGIGYLELLERIIRASLAAWPGDAYHAN
jgi:D-alanine-D-alanine ligase